MKKKMIISFFLPIFIFCLTNLIIGNGFTFIYKMMDVYAQYIPLAKYLKGFYMLDNSIFYSFFKGLGGSMWTTFFYYLSSPLNAFIIFFNNINVFLFFICSIKIGLCGFTMYKYLNSLFKDKDNFNMLFAMCYALMGFNTCFFSNYFWIDTIYMAPIVLMGIEKLIKNGKISLYVFSLSFSIFCNFYLSFNLCIFCVIYFVYKLMINNSIDKIKCIKKFIFSSLIVAGICSAILLPVVIELLGIHNRLKISSFINSDYHFILGLFYKGLIGSSDILFSKIILDNVPNIYTSILALILNILFFFNKQISLKEKIIVGVIYLFFISSMIFKPLYLFWHGFSDTFDFYYRFSYLWSFLNIIIAYKSLLHIRFFYRYKRMACLIIGLYYICAVMIYFAKIVPFYNGGLEIIISLIFAIIYLFILLRKDKYRLLLLIVIIELFVNCCISMNFETSNKLSSETSDSKDQPTAYYEICNRYKQILKNKQLIRISDLYDNSSLYCNYGAFSSYLSTSNENISLFYNKIVGEVSVVGVSGVNNTLLINSLLSGDYIVEKDKIIKNNYALSIGYMINYKDVFYDNNELNYQTDLLNSMTNLNLKYFDEIEPIKKNQTTYDFYCESSNKYLYMNGDRKNVRNILINSEENFGHTVFNVLDNDISVNITLACEDFKEGCFIPDIKLYTINFDNLTKAIDKLAEQQLIITKIEKNVLEGTIDVKKNNQYLFLSIPYEKGWYVYVDGEKVNYEKLYGSFIGIKLSKGYHELKMKFYPYGLNYGIVISFISTILLLIYFILERKKIINIKK